MARTTLALASAMAASAAASTDMANACAMGSSALCAASVSIAMRPPRNASARTVPRTTWASVMVGTVPPRA